MSLSTSKIAILVGFFLFNLVFTVSRGISAEQLAVTDVAIKGYDPVAYFENGKAMKGSESFTYQWHNLTWHFLSETNAELFADSPEKYAPQYDGFCAWAMTEKRKAVTDPEVWKIVNSRLYLNCSQAAYEKWNKDIPGNIEKADKNWAEMNSAD